MGNNRSCFRSFGVKSVSFPSDPASVGILVRALGPALALQELPPDYWTVAFGKFKDGGDPLRVGIYSQNSKGLKNVLLPHFRSTLRNVTGGIELSEPDDGMAWLRDCSIDVITYDLELPVPLLEAHGEIGLWMSDFLQEIANLQTEYAGIILKLRPTVPGPEVKENGKIESLASARNLNPWFALRKHFERVPIESESTSRPQADFASQTQTQKQTAHQTYGHDLRRRGLAICDELVSTGGWWLSIRAFGKTDTHAQQAAAIYWAVVARNASVNGQANDPTGFPAAPFIRASSSLSTESSSWDKNALDPSEPLKCFGKEDRGLTPKELRQVLRDNGIDLGFYRPSLEEKRNDEKSSSDKALYAVRRLVTPLQNEKLISGGRLSSLFQLPVRPNPLLRVIRGFDYCAVPDVLKKTNTLNFGVLGRGGVFETDSKRPVQLESNELTKHTLIVGATGSRKTTTLLYIIKELTQNGVPVTVLEGAKAEYRSFAKTLGIASENVYDFRNHTFPLNIFEHPPSISPEEHVSQIAAVFESTLSMPAPLPAILKEAIGEAYADYHSTQDLDLKKMHPVRFWLLRAAKRVSARLGYTGENKATIEGALRTRLGSLSTGTAGRVLGGDSKEASWEEAKRNFSTSAILELEAIADRHARSLIMSLFVVYFRYAMKDSHRAEDGDELRHILVLEEAHRIIGRSNSAEESSLEYFSNILSEIRSYGVGVIISDQSPSRLIEDAMRNTNTKIIMRLVSGDDIRSATIGAGLPESAQRDIPRLGAGEAIMLTPNRLPQFVKIADKDVRSWKTEMASESVSPTEARRVFTQETRLAQLHFDLLNDLYSGGRAKPLKTPMTLLESGWREILARSESAEDIAARARLAVGCDCGDASESVFAKCDDHGEDIVLWGLKELVAATR